MLADDHERRANTYTELADLVHTALEAHDEEGPMNASTAWTIAVADAANISRDRDQPRRPAAIG